MKLWQKLIKNAGFYISLSIITIFFILRYAVAPKQDKKTEQQVKNLTTHPLLSIRTVNSPRYPVIIRCMLYVNNMFYYATFTAFWLTSDLYDSMNLNIVAECLLYGFMSWLIGVAFGYLVGLASLNTHPRSK